MAKKCLIVFFLLTMSLSGGVVAQDATMPKLVNLDHLKYLTETVTVNDQQMALVHIYSEYPEYEWVDAAGEGLSAVDDVARAAIVYLWQYERTQDESLLQYARDCLEFVRYMQVDDGEFYNFVYDREGTINERGNTSYKSLGWWAMRGLWALGEGVRVFNQVDPEYADVLAEAYLRTEAALGATMGNYGEMISVHGFDVPAWIPGGEPAVSAVGLLGLAAYHEARPNATTADIMTKLGDGLAQYRLGDHSTYPFGMHPVKANAPGFWHDWGSHTTHALAVAGMELDRQDWIASAAASADSFLLRQLAFERFRRIGVIPYRLEQIAYGTNMLVLTYMSLYEATGEERYARYGGLAASWYFDNNMAGVRMVDPETGRTLDGINGPVSWRVNRNSGAESTIEGLMSMIAVADVPLARGLLNVTPVERDHYLILQAENGRRVVGTPVYFSGNWTGEGYISDGRYVGIGEGQKMRLEFEVEQENDYLLYVAHVRQPATSNTNMISRTDSPPTVNADFSDWPDDLPVLAIDTQGQFLRGGGVWKGPDVDSVRLQLMWDDDNLYIQAIVRDPEHNQPYTLSTAWQGDTVWFYMTNHPDAQQLSAKFTFAETPDGPQIWDWANTRFLPGAVLAFQLLDEGGGYVYEASVPWESLDVESPQAGMRIGFETGRGIGGSSFMDLTGRDPDVPANLLQLMLSEPDMEMSAATTPQVSLQMRLDDGDWLVIPQSISTDSDYFWLDLVSSTPVHLTPGEHILRYQYYGEEGESSNPGLSKVDAFYLQPVIARRVLSYPDGRTITLTYNTLTGETSWQE
jgi:hypothetical protein